MSNIAFIGLGHMGLPMAKNLLAHNMSVSGFDLSADAINAFKEAGGAAADSIAHAVVDADVVITMLPNATIVESVYDEIRAAVPAGALFVDSSTIDVATARKVADDAESAGFMMVDAPVSGGVGGAAAGTLAFMVGGPAEGFKKAEPILHFMGAKIVHCGQSGNGQAAKACNNMLLAISMIGVSEAFNLGRSLGLDDQTFFDVASNASGQCWSLTTYCPAPGPVPSAPSNNDFKPGFATALMLKDLGIAMGAAADTGAKTPLGKMARDIYAQMDAEGHGGIDFSGVIEHLSGKLE